MKRILGIIALFISFFASAQDNEVAPRRPSPPKLVNDFTGTLTTEQKDALERKLVAYNDSTSTQIAIVVIPSLKGNSLEETALKILREWGVGGKDNNNGVVILVAKDDRKIRIETGYGLEGAIPDVTAKAIIDHSLTPHFRTGNYYRGLDEAINDIIQAAAGRYKAPKGYGKNIGPKGVGLGIIIFIFIVLMLAIGRGGRGGGGMVSRRGYRDIGTGWILGSLLGGSGGGGGGWSGGGGGWSGGGGGGFGGFGGGSGGGGGASGGW